MKANNELCRQPVKAIHRVPMNKQPLSTVEELLKQGASLNCRTDGVTPLEYAGALEIISKVVFTPSGPPYSLPCHWSDEEIGSKPETQKGITDF
jgi:hypothetical protein